MGKELIVKHNEDETMVAVSEDQQLVEIYFERSENQSIMGNIYKGRVDNVLPGMQAAFVNIGEAKNGFLYVNDAVPRQMDPDGNILEPHKSIEQVLKAGQELLVQIMKEPVGTKGARITTHPTIPGRYVVLMPTVKYIGISRRIEDEDERERLKSLAREILNDKMGVIIRTSAEGVSHDELAKDIKLLIKQWKRIQQKAIKVSAPALVHKDYTLLDRMVRDVFVGEIDKVYADSAECKEELQELLAVYMPDVVDRVVVAGRDIMQVNDLEAQLEKALRHKVWLKCGSYLVIEQMEALTVIDVNTGKYVGEDNLEATVFKTNLEAASEIARQLRLRNIGGIIIVDFIDMRDEEDRTAVIDHFTNELKKDRIKTNILGMTQLGLLEMTRKKNGQGLSSVLMKSCPFCSGHGQVFSDETMYIFLKKELVAVAATASTDGIYVEVNPALAAYLLGSGGSNIGKLEKQLGKSLLIRGNPSMRPEDMIVRPCYEDGAGSGAVSPVSLDEELEVRVEGLQDDHPENGIARVNGFVIVIENGAEYYNQHIRIKVAAVFSTYAKAVVLV